MYDVFISYRTEDGHAAGRLCKRLEEEFSTFMASAGGILAGERIESEVFGALAEAKVLIAIIGEKWVSKRQLKRLHREDWIYRELTTAVNRVPKLEILTVLVDDVRMPTPKVLPPALHWLSDIKAFALRHATWDEDEDGLVRLIAEKLAGNQNFRAAPAPHLLPHLCDRVTQEEELVQVIRDDSQQRSLACIVHGHMWEAHDGFLSRLEHRRTLQELFDADETGVGVHRLQWNAAHASAGNYVELLISALKRKVLKITAADAELIEFLRDPLKPQVVALQVTWNDLTEFGQDMLDRLTAAWHELTARAAPLNQRLLLWINVTYDDVDQRVPDASLAYKLTELEPVRAADIQTWMTLDEVKRYVVGHEKDLLKLAHDPARYVAPGRLRMQHFVDSVLHLFSNRSPAATR